jgi:competence protein ComEC
VRARRVLVLSSIALYVPLAGAGPSIQRAGVMGAAGVVAALAGRPASRWYAILLAAVATLALDPRALADAGWQLSFAAVLGIATLAPTLRDRLRRSGLPGALTEAVAVTAAATLSTAPLIAARFGQGSLVSLPVNVLAAPAVAPIMWLGMAAAALSQLTPALAAPVTALSGPPLGYLVWLARSAAALPAAHARVPAASVAIVAVALAIALVGRRHVTRAASVVAAATVAATLWVGARPAPVAPSPAPGTLRVTALDVGQGDATLLQAGAHAVLVDAGPPQGAVVDRLRAAGVARLDALVISHPQLDHDGGAPAVLEALPVGVLLDGRGGDRAPASRALDGPLRRRHTRVVAAAAGQELRAGPLRLRILWPPPGPTPPAGDPNDRAIVAVATAYGASALLTADAESLVLAGLDVGPVDVLKVSHHGSADPGLPALLGRVRPRAALIEVGRHNRYGHPAPTTLQALAAVVPFVRRTDRDGTVRVDVRRKRGIAVR